MMFATYAADMTPFVVSVQARVEWRQGNSGS